MNTNECSFEASKIDTEKQQDEKVKKEKQRKPLTIFEYDFCYFFVGMIVFSFLGFVTENVTRMVLIQVFDCRHQLLPFLFAYGLALLAIYVIIGTPDDLRFFNIRIFKEKTKVKRALSHLLYFLIICAFIFGGEIAVGMIYEKVAGVVLWNYSNIPTHVTNYTSVITTALLGGGVYLLMNFAFRPMMSLIEKMGRQAGGDNNRLHAGRADSGRLFADDNIHICYGQRTLFLVGCVVKGRHIWPEQHTGGLFSAARFLCPPHMNIAAEQRTTKSAAKYSCPYDLKRTYYFIYANYMLQKNCQQRLFII